MTIEKIEKMDERPVNDVIKQVIGISF